MRIWSIHPKYLDAKGLVALWREALLARKVLEGKTAGYRYHPQLDRFKESGNPVDAINQYLSSVYDESVDRHFSFDSSKLSKPGIPVVITVTDGQILFEFEHLLGKLKEREIMLYNKLNGTTSVSPHPIFTVIKGEVEKWEKVTPD
jgi:hypothetical protein